MAINTNSATASVTNRFMNAVGAFIDKIREIKNGKS